MAVGLNQSEAQSQSTSPVQLMPPAGRWSSIVLVATTLAVFASVNAFWQFLSTGQWINYSPEAIRRDLAVPLGQMLLGPLSIFNYPWMTLVAGFIMAVVIFVPILTAVLARLRLAILFVVIVAVIGHAPLLAGALVIGCVLTSRSALKSDTPFLAVLLGLIPVAVYLYLFGLSLLSEAAVLPLQRGVAGAPFLIALISASLVCGLALSLARLARYRQAVVWPVIILLMSGPMTVFYLGVGTDELEYSLLTGDLAPGDSIYRTVYWRKSQQKISTSGPSDRRGESIESELFKAYSDRLMDRRMKLIESCREFVAGYPDSKRAPAVLWVAAQCLSLKVSRPVLGDGRVMYYASHPSEASLPIWEMLVDQYPKSRQAAIGNWRLGQLILRKIGAKPSSDKAVSYRLAQAEKHLSIAEERLTLIVQADGDSDQLGDGVFLPVPLLPARGCYRQALVEVQRLRWLLEANNVAETWELALAGGKPKRDKARKLLRALSALLSIDPDSMTRGEYRKRLGRLLRDDGFESTDLGDNITVAWSNALSKPSERALALIALAVVRPPTDASIQASFELGLLALGSPRTETGEKIKELRKPQEYFKLVIAAPDNPWKPMARERLTLLESLEKKPE